MKWVTRSGVRLDRTACAWLIRRHIDPDAEISYLEAKAIPAAVQAGALPFHNTTSEEPDMERTSFDQLIAEYKLDQKDAALVLLAGIVHGAELHDPDAPAEAAGLHAILKGVNALSHGDEDMINRSLPVLDALYAYCQRQAAGKSGWPNQDSPVKVVKLSSLVIKWKRVGGKESNERAMGGAKHE